MSIYRIYDYIKDTTKFKRETRLKVRKTLDIGKGMYISYMLYDKIAYKYVKIKVSVITIK